MCITDQRPAPASTREALDALHASLAYLASVDAAELTIAEQADCLRALAGAESVHTAATVSVLAAFTASGGYESDGQVSARAWLRWQAKVTRGAAAGTVGWMRRLAGHPAVWAALAAGQVSPSWARQVCEWTSTLPCEAVADADDILLAAALAGSGLADLAGLAEEIHRRCARPDNGPDTDGFEGRQVRLATYFHGAGHLDGDLTPECTTALRAVLDALGTRAGPEDSRSPAERDHDALEEMCRRLIASGCLPDRGGQPTQIMLHMTLEQLLGLDGPGDSAADWAGRGATAGPGADCDATIVPVVTGHIDEEMVDQLAHAMMRTAGGAPDAATAARELLLDRATRLLSGPAGIAAQLRTGLLPRPAAAISLPLDIGAATETIPAHLRRAVTVRDQHCAFPGCDRPPKACQVHHIIPRSRGGPTSLSNCVTLCPFHHLIAIHRWGWQLTLHPDGTTTATSPDGRTLHSHAPPTAA